MTQVKVPKPASRLASFSDNAIIWVARSAQSSPVKPLIDLGLGLMEHNPPEFVRDAYKKSLERTDVNQYGPSEGLPEFRQALADVYSPLYKRNLSPDKEISIHTGGSEALLSAIMAYVEQDDEVILLEPAFPLYECHILFVGGKLVYVPLTAPGFSGQNVDSNQWSVDVEAIKKAITPKTKMLVVNNPHNPLGKVFTEAELRAIGEVCVQHGIIILSDEVYEFTNFDSDPIPRIATLDRDIGKLTLTVGSVGKAFNATGWRAGWIIGDEALIPPVEAAHVALCYVPPGPPQVAATVGFKEADERGFWESNKQEMKGRVDTLCSILDEVGLNYSRPNCAYFLFFSAGAIQVPDSFKFPEEVAKMTRDCQICWFLMQKLGIVTIPGSAFYSKDHAHLGSDMLRLVACKNPAGLELARERFLQLKQYVKA